LIIEDAQILPADMIFRFLDTTGDGSGTKNANVNGSVTPVIFRINAPTGYEYIIPRMLVKIEDASASFSAENYGAISTLANGITLAIHDENGDSILDLLDGLTIKSNVNWARYAFDNEFSNFGNGNVFLRVRWSFFLSGSPLVIRPGHSLRATIRDDLTGLVGHYFQVQGRRRQA
jgi:hypothetical protein